MTSLTLWIPLTWFIILGTRSVSMWFADAGLQAETLDDYLDGSPFDRNIFIGLLIAGLAVLIKRRAMLCSIFSNNRLFFAFMIFCGISCFWSDYPVASFKRYIKDVGNLIMALIIITETKPEEALRAILARYTYLAITLSALFIKYIPEYGRYYSRWTYEVVYCGITTNKNILGQVAFICGIFLVWDIITTRSTDNKSSNKLDLLIRILFMALVIWLLYMAHSTTSILCMILGIAIILCLNSSLGKKQVRNLGTWTMGLLFLMITVFTIPGLLNSFTGIFGKDATLTGRMDIWQALLALPINPLLGEGYQSFWQTPAAARLGETFYFIPNQAHNGYLEVYIQTGLISLFFLVGSIITATNKLKKEIFLGSTHAIQLFSFFIVILIGNWTEATINKLSILWFILMLALLHCYIDSSTKQDIYGTKPINNKLDGFPLNERS